LTDISMTRKTKKVGPGPLLDASKRSAPERTNPGSSHKNQRHNESLNHGFCHVGGTRHSGRRRFNFNGIISNYNHCRGKHASEQGQLAP
jgi:hypothetical protein